MTQTKTTKVSPVKAPRSREEVGRDRLDKIELKQQKVSARTPNQAEYIKTVLEHDLTFCLGPAGTGKTHLAIGIAITKLKKGKYDKIIVCRPVVDAGESIGYLPGGLDEKMAPYIRPLYDELGYFISKSETEQLVELGIIEICPLAYMRGRTFKNAFIICDEAQNACKPQIKMLLSRLGEGSCMVVIGDNDQCDLPASKQGALKKAVEIYENVEEIGSVELTKDDIVRHPLLARAIELWENAEKTPKAD